MSLSFDFGTQSSPVASGYTRVSPDTTYSSSRGFGLTSSVDSRDRGAGSDDVRRDFVNATSIGFVADVPNGTYTVTTLSGDMIATSRTDFTIEGRAMGHGNAGRGSVTGVVHKDVVVTDGQLTLVASGSSPRLNAVTITGTATGGVRLLLAVAKLSGLIAARSLFRTRHVETWCRGAWWLMTRRPCHLTCTAMGPKSIQLRSRIRRTGMMRVGPPPRHTKSVASSTAKKPPWPQVCACGAQGTVR